LFKKLDGRGDKQEVRGVEFRRKNCYYTRNES
jgi:hypothetical protein